jgi:hypothetical protein
MRVQFSSVGYVERHGFTMDLQMVPHEGDHVHIKGVSPDPVVRHVDWYLLHNDEDEAIDEPFIYVVIGPPRPDNNPRWNLQQYLERPRD